MKNKVTATTYVVKDELVNTYINAGFPEDYAKKIAILKTIHPNWNFLLF